MRRLTLLFTAVMLISCSEDDSTIINDEKAYFPGNGDAWQQTSVRDMGWNEKAIAPLLDFLETQNTKSFMVIADGKIVMENYFRGHTRNSVWQWANADKTLTAAVAGIAQQEGYINLDNSITDYLGQGWTSAPADKETAITCRHLLSMTSGLDAGEGMLDTPQSLRYNNDAGTTWAYTDTDCLLTDVIATATGKRWEDYFSEKIGRQIGMNGSWYKVNGQRMYKSDTRSMARFGLLALNNGNWNGTQIIDRNYFTECTSSSQDINKSFGYLWWVNGQESHLLPKNDHLFPGSIVLSAPDDMYMGYGNMHQRIYVVPSLNIVVVRMGEAADESTTPFSGFDEQLWVRLNSLIQ
ncbi:serine hydrolase [Flavobacterium sp.]|uniref:serine hydrolase domain-containing protein n=1 Tax=Flavobacterium sp. TaxID=239 RepID=UPI002630DD48|nr:serine hydrolase [Flavobacterium sp.]